MPVRDRRLRRDGIIRLATGEWPSGKAPDSGSGDRRFESFLPSRSHTIPSHVDPGRIVILNGPPRSGKSSIVAVIQKTFDGVWMNLGVDVFAIHVTPEKVRPGIGLRPGEPDHPASALVPSMYAALYDSIAAHARAGLNVVVDVGHYDRELLAACARRLDGLAVL